MRSRRFLGAAGIVVALLLVSPAADAAGRLFFRANGGGGSIVQCPGGMSSLEHVFDESNSMFEGDPTTHVQAATTVEDDGYLVEAVDLGTHTGTHLDAPGHFVPGGRFVDELRPEELVGPLYVIDVRDRMAAAAASGEPVDFQLTPADIEAYVAEHGRIKDGSFVVIQTGFDRFFGTAAYDDPAPGFAGPTVQWLVDTYDVRGIGSDTYGPDATSDEFFDATYTILLNDRVAVPGLNGLDQAGVKGDVLMVSPVRLADGSGFQVNPVACHGTRAPAATGDYRDLHD